VEKTLQSLTKHVKELNNRNVNPGKVLVLGELNAVRAELQRMDKFQPTPFSAFVAPAPTPSSPSNRGRDRGNTAASSSSAGGGKDQQDQHGLFKRPTRASSSPNRTNTNRTSRDEVSSSVSVSQSQSSGSVRELNRADTEATMAAPQSPTPSSLSGGSHSAPSRPAKTSASSQSQAQAHAQKGAVDSSSNSISRSK